MKTIRFLLIGVGNVGRRFLELIILKRDSLHDRLGLRLVLAGVADR
jgi:homoserine dehydrogenase